MQVSTGDGKLVRVRTTKFEEMMQSVQLLHTFNTEMEGAYYDYVAPTAEASSRTRALVLRGARLRAMIFSSCFEGSFRNDVSPQEHARVPNDTCVLG